MNKDEILKIAEDYMRKKNIDIISPGEIGEVKEDKVEVIFLDPDALNPRAIVCPPDSRVWVDKKTKEITWIHQM